MTMRRLAALILVPLALALAAPAPSFAADAPAESAHLSHDQLKDLVTLVLARGHDENVDKQVAAALGFAKSGEPLVMRQLVADFAKGPSHAVFLAPDGGFLFASIEQGVSFTVYRADGDQKLVTGVREAKGGKPETIAKDAAEKGLSDEIATWISIVANVKAGTPPPETKP